jgi:hypothetical protein
MNIKKLLTWFGIIGSVASIFSLIYIFLPKDNNIKLSVLTVYQENLTQDSDEIEPDLKISYQFKNLPISNLWKYNIRFVNNSKKTLIGVSNQKNILTDHLQFNLNSGLEILDYNKIQSQFNHTTIQDSTNFKIAFEQWRPNEILEYSFYVRSNSTLAPDVLFKKLDFRQIVDGDIFYKNALNEIEQKRITEIIPPQGLQASYIISLIFTGLFIIVFTIFLFLTPFSYYKANTWYKNHHPDFIQFIKQTYPDKKDLQERYISKPKYLPKSKWDDFDGDQFPDLSVDLDVKKFYQFVLTVTIFFSIDISLIVTFVDLIYYFP